MLISQERLSASLSRSDYRLTMARARRRRHKRMMVAGGCVLGALLLLFVAVKLAVRNPPLAPRLTVAWPSTQLGSATVPEGAMLLARSGQPLLVSVEGAQSWRLSVRDGAATLQNNRARWTPSAPETLTLECRPLLSGWRALGNPFAPRYTLHLRSLRAGRLDDGRLILRATNGKAANDAASALVSSRVRAGQGVVWDERALPLLEAAAREIAPTTPAASGTRWILARSFDSDSADTTTQDAATYAVLDDSQPRDGSNADTLAKLARIIAARAPQTGIKCVGGARIGTALTLSVIRLAFDGTGARDGWRKVPGQDVGQKWRWWDDAAAPGS